MNRRLLAASILLFVRAGLTGPAGLGFLLTAAFFWLTKPLGPVGGSDAADGVLTIVVAGGLAVLGAIGLAIATPALIFGALIQTRKRWAQWSALVGESFIALLLAFAVIWGLTHPADQVVTVPAAIGLVVGSAPVVVLLVSGLTKRES